MAETGKTGWIAKFRDTPNDYPVKTLVVALGVALVCAVVVSTVAVVLKPLQDANRERDRQQHIMAIIERLPGIEALLETTGGPQVEAHVVELATGAYLRSIDPADYDQRQAAKDPQQSIELPAEHDIARIVTRAKYAAVYLVREAGRIKLIILPVHGLGYASTLYGFIALEGDGNTVVALSFFEHGETPGMGARVDDPDWRSKWAGKRLRDEEGRLRIEVAKGRVDPDSPAALYRVDGISGATRTTQGVANLLRFWLGDYGFGPFLQKVQSVESSP